MKVILTTLMIFLPLFIFSQPDTVKQEAEKIYNVEVKGNATFNSYLNIDNKFDVQGEILIEEPYKIEDAVLKLYDSQGVHLENKKIKLTKEGKFSFTKLESDEYYMTLSIKNKSIPFNSRLSPFFIPLNLKSQNHKKVRQSINLSDLQKVSLVVDTRAKIIVLLDNKRIFSNYERFKCGSDFDDIFRMEDNYTEMQYYLIKGNYQYEVYEALFDEKMEGKTECDKIIKNKIITSISKNINHSEKIYIPSVVFEPNGSGFLAPRVVNNERVLGYNYNFRTIGYRNKRLTINLEYALDDGSLIGEKISKTIIVNKDIQTHKLSFKVPTKFFNNQNLYFDNFTVTDEEGNILLHNKLYQLFRSRISDNSIRRVRIYKASEERKLLQRIQGLVNLRRCEEVKKLIREILKKPKETTDTTFIRLLQGVNFYECNELKEARGILFPLANEDNKAAQEYYIDCFKKQSGIYFEKGKYQLAAKELEEALIIAEKYPKAYSTPKLAALHGRGSWYQICNKNFNRAEQLALRGLELDKSQKWIEINLAHSFLFSENKEKEERAYNLYNSNIGLKIGRGLWESIINQDFQKLKSIGINSSKIKTAEKKISRKKNR